MAAEIFKQTTDSSMGRATVDVVIPVYGERFEALDATLSACMRQNYPIETIFVVDDGSPQSVSLPPWAQDSAQIRLIRLHENQGISAARNAGIARSEACLIACINTEVLPDPDWLTTCVDYLISHPRAGACFTRLVPAKPNRLLTRWRMRFLELQFGASSKAVEFATGHAVLFRKEAVDLVGGYDVRYRYHHEDSDVCIRIRKAGWETHYVATSRCLSIQEDSLRQLAAKQLRDSNWYSPADSLLRLYYHLSWWTLNRAGRNVVKGRFHLLPADFAIWAVALWMATVRKLRSAQRLHRSGAPRG
jgi:cellulose synthase/poly-beta-1,6-N-acetylglucosamine synthase-like glycosyltransferase